MSISNWRASIAPASRGLAVLSTPALFTTSCTSLAVFAAAAIVARHIYHFQVFGEVCLRKGLALIVGLGAPHHGLAPPVLDNAVGHLRARSVEAVEGAARKIEIELRAIGGELLPHPVEYLQRQAARVSRCLHHDRR